MIVCLGKSVYQLTCTVIFHLIESDIMIFTWARQQVFLANALVVRAILI